MLYRQYDQKGLDGQYNMRERVPSFPDFVARWAAQSAPVRAQPDARLDLSYGGNPRERLDLFSCGQDGAPLHVFIHGGYWQAMDKEHFAYVANGLLPHGFDVAVIEYALAPEVTVGEIVRQCRAAVAWLWRHASDHGFDRDRITISGHSAGGHLTAMLLLSDWSEFASDLPVNVLKGGLAISGLYDLEPIRLSYLNAALGLQADDVQALSPIHLVHQAAAAPPLLVAVGGDETDEFQRQQADFLEQWTSRGLPGEAVAMPGTNHFSVVDGMGETASALVSAIRRLSDGTVV